MTVNGVPIEDGFAEAFGMACCRLVVTAADAAWAGIAAAAATGYGCSVIGCDAEAGIERTLPPAETPDGRPGVSLLLFAFGREALGKAVANRVGQCVMTCPTTAVFDGMPAGARRAPLGAKLRYFGDGRQASKVIAGQRFWRVPVMDGEFLCCEDVGTADGVAGGNFLLAAESQAAALEACAAAVAAARTTPGVILPFPGGAARSGSKVGSRYRGLRASTNEAYCPTLRGLGGSALPERAAAVYELVIDGVDLAAVEEATRRGIVAACRPGVLGIFGGNYGGSLGKFQVHLRRLFQDGEKA